MGRKTGHQQEKAVQAEPLRHFLSHHEMAKMWRIEGATEEAQAQGGHASGGPLPAGPSPDLLCGI